ncbi:membrane dipeptidase [Patescibacteria group bacterium]|nr:membrane dipeptidase [Patescibacteria group bacterium]
MLIDLAHASQKSFEDIMQIVKKPVMVSHTKITDRRDKARFLTVDQAKKVADGGGIIGIMTMKSEDDQFSLVDLESYVKHIKQAMIIA